MFCLRSWIPLLFIPANASPGFIFLFFICTYFLNRPCVYCSILLLILFVTSCYWSDRCFFEFSSNWFAPRMTSAASATFESWVGIESRYFANSTAAPAMMVVLDDSIANNFYNSTTIETLNTTASALSSIVAYTASFESWIESHNPANATTTVDPAFYNFFNSTTLETLNITVSALARIASESLARRKRTEWTGLGIEWLRSLLGKREWRIECMDVNIRL